MSASQTFQRRSFGIFVVLFLLILSAGHFRGANLTVCASGCTYTNAQLQTAINDASATANDVILLQEGFTYIGDYTLPVKTGAGSSNKVTIRTGVNSTGTIQPLSRYPAANVRVCPQGFVEGAYDCSTRNPYDTSRLAKIQPLSNDVMAMRTVFTGSGTPVSYYKLQWLEFQPNSYGGNALIGLYNETNPTGNAGGSAFLPHHFELDQLYVHGHPYKGQFRGIYAGSNHTSITNSHFSDIKAIGEGQVLLINSATDGWTVTNNFMSGGTETILTGGGGTFPNPTYTVQASPAPTTTVFAVDRVTDLYVTKQIAVKSRQVNIASSAAGNPIVITTASAHGFVDGDQVDVTGHTGVSCDFDINYEPFTIRVLSTTTFSLYRSGGTSPQQCYSSGGATGNVRVRASAEITNISGNTITVSPALRYAPVTGDTVESSLVLRNATFRYNWLTRPASWWGGTSPNNILPTVTVSTPQAFTTGGSMATQTACYRVQATVQTAQNQTGRSFASPEQCVSVTGPTGRVVLNWTAVTGAEGYTIYGRTTGAQNLFWTVAAGTTTFTDTGTGGTSGSVSASNSWGVKNTFELKQGREITAEYNIIENSWTQGQTGACVLFTLTQQNEEADSATLRHITFRYNWVRECAQFVQLPGRDALGHESARAYDIDIVDNLVTNIGGNYGGGTSFSISTGGGPRQGTTRGVSDLTIEHNTIHFLPTSLPPTAIAMDQYHTWPTPNTESTNPNTRIANNIWYAGEYGIMSADPAQSCALIIGRIGSPPLAPTSLVTTNALVGDLTATGRCGAHQATTTNTTCPTRTDVETNTFTGPLTTIPGFAVKNTSTYYLAGTDGRSLGADTATINTGMAITMSGDNSGVPSPLDITTTSLPTGYRTRPYNTSGCFQLQTSGGTLPITNWEFTAGNLTGTGLTLGQTTGQICGTPTATVNNRSLTIRATDSAANQATETLVLNVLPFASRAERYNWTWGAFFVQETRPTIDDQPETGDLWYRPSTGEYRRLTVAGSTVSDQPIVTATGGSSGIKTITSWAAAPESDTPGTGGIEFGGTRWARIIHDAESSTQCSISFSLHDANSTAGATLKMQYWDGVSTWIDTGCSGSTAGANGIIKGAWATLPVAARNQYQEFRAFHSTGDGVDAVTISSIHMHFR